MSIDKIILETLKKAGKPLKAGEIAELADVDKKDIDKAIKTMKTEDVIFSPKRCYYDAK